MKSTEKLSRYRRYLIATAAMTVFGVGSGSPLTAQTLPDQATEQPTPNQPTLEAPAVDTSAEDSSEIVVTAQRREQSLQDVGIAVAAYGGEQLRTLGVTSSVEIARITPGVFISANNGGQTSQFSIRGVTQNDFSDAVEGPVAVYIDEGYVPNLQGQTFGLFDIERVEVLKGPQGTLFGRNATGGLVHFVVNKPTEELDGFIDATYGRYNQVKVDAAVGGPIVGNLLGRLSVYYSRHDEILKNIYPGDIPAGVLAGMGAPIDKCCEDLWNDDTLGVRLQLEIEPLDGLTVRATGSAMRQNLSIAPYNSVATVPVVDAQGRVVNGIYAGLDETRTGIGPDGSNFTGFSGAPPSRLPGRTWFGYRGPPGKDLEIANDFAQDDVNRTRSYNAQLHVDYDLGDVTISSLTDYKKLTKDMGIDADSSPVNLIDVWADADTRSFSQELRATGQSAGLTWTVGAYYLRIRTLAVGALLAPPRSVFANIVGFPVTGVDLTNVPLIKTNSYSAFGQVEYEFIPQWTFVLGGRIIKEKQAFDFTSSAYLNENDYGIDLGTELFPLQPSFHDRRSKTLWAGKAQLEFRPNDDFLLYAGVNRGVKGGNYNSKLPDGSPNLTPEQIPYKPEVLLSYEGGLKATLAGGRVQLNAAAYYYDYSNYQAFTFQNVSGFVQNRDARTYGAELSISAEVIDGLRIGGSAAVIDAKVKDVQVASGVFRDVKPTFTPETQISGTISYEIPSPVMGGSLTLGGTGSYSSSFYQNIRNFDSQKLKGYELFDARIVWTNAADNFTLTGVLNNIFDKRYAVTGFDLSTLCGCTEIAYGRPRWWSVTGAFKF